MTEFLVVDVGFFIKPHEDAAVAYAHGREVPAEGIEPSLEYRAWGRVTVQASGNDDGRLWLQQAVVEGRLDWPLYDWSVSLERECVVPVEPGEDPFWPDWSPPDEPSRPFGTQDRRRVVALALHRAHAIIARVDPARF